MKVLNASLVFFGLFFSLPSFSGDMLLSTKSCEEFSNGHWNSASRDVIENIYPTANFSYATAKTAKMDPADFKSDCPAQLVLKPGMSIVAIYHLANDADGYCAYKSMSSDISLNVTDWQNPAALRCKRSLAR